MIYLHGWWIQRCPLWYDVLQHKAAGYRMQQNHGKGTVQCYCNMVHILHSLTVSFSSSNYYLCSPTVTGVLYLVLCYIGLCYDSTFLNASQIFNTHQIHFILHYKLSYGCSLWINWPDMLRLDCIMLLIMLLMLLYNAARSHDMISAILTDIISS